MADKTPKDLRWIDEEPKKITTERPEFDEFELVGNKSFSKNVLQKCQDNLLVPIGLLATVACLTMGLVSFRRGNSRNQQLFMRGRVGFQAFTLFAMTGSMFFATNSKRKHTDQK